MLIAEGDADLLEIVGALDPPRRLHRRQQERDEDRHDRNHDQELDQGEATIPVPL
jgi:hypothetical protein